jgi:tetratricopeptide (TPR) repeat protein
MGALRRIPYEVLSRVPWPSPDYAEGLKDVILHTESGHPLYLLGKRSEEGWWWSSFVVIAAKTPLPLLALGLASIVVTIRNRALWRGDLLFLFFPAMLVLATNVSAKLGLGVRHLLPMYPFWMIFAAWPLRGGGFPGGIFAAVGVALLLAGEVVGTLRAHPHYIPYFNFVAGGSSGGYRILGDSNLDWGQDLSEAASRLKSWGATGAILCYFGTADPFAEDLAWQLLPPAQRGKGGDPWRVLPTEGPQWLLMSATNRQGIYYRTPGGGEAYPFLEKIEPKEVVGGSIFLYEIGSDADVQWGLAEIYGRHGMIEEREAALRRVLARRKHDSNARKNLFSSLMAKGDSTGAADLIEAAPNPDAGEIAELARIRLRLGEIDKAKLYYEKGVKHFKSDSDFKNSYAWFLQETGGDLDRALEVIDEAIGWKPEDPYYRDTRAMIQRKRGELNAALRDVDEALELPGGHLPEIRWHRALVLQALGKRAEALSEARALSGRADLEEGLRSEIESWLAER